MKIGFAITGSFCTVSKAVNEMEKMIQLGYEVTPIMSENAYTISTRFGKAAEINERIEALTGKRIINTITDAEPIGPGKMFDVLCVVPCTSNTLAKLAHGITDTAVTMAVKSHIRNSRPVVIGISTNDALGAAAKNIGILMNYKNYYFVPFGMDSPLSKPKSMVCDFTKTIQTVENAYEGKQINLEF